MERLRSALARHAHRLPVNATDPLSCEPLRASRVVPLADGSGRRLYDAATLAEALWGCGNFQDPFTRRPLLAPELLRIDHAVARSRRVAPSLLLEHRLPTLRPLLRSAHEERTELERGLDELRSALSAALAGHRCTCRTLLRAVFELGRDAAAVLLSIAAIDIDASIEAYERFRAAFAACPAAVLRELDTALAAYTR